MKNQIELVWFGLWKFYVKKQADGDAGELQNNQRLFDMSSKIETHFTKSKWISFA